MKHGRIKDIECLKKAVAQFESPKLTMIEIPKGRFIARADGCSSVYVEVVKDTDGTFHLEWDSRAPDMAAKVLRGVEKLMRLYIQNKGVVPEATAPGAETPAPPPEK